MFSGSVKAYTDHEGYYYLQSISSADFKFTSYNYDTNVFSNLATFDRHIVMNYKIFVEGQYIYLIGGMGSLDYNLKYNRDTNTWSDLSNMPSISANAGQCIIHQKESDFVYTNSDLALGNTDWAKYQISTDTWTVLTDVPTTTEINYCDFDSTFENIYVMYYATGALYKYNIAGNSWTTLISAGVSVRGLTQISGYLYAVQYGATSYIQQYSISGNSWTQKASYANYILTFEDYSNYKTNLGSDIIYFDNTAKSLIKYNVVSNVWTDLSNISSTFIYPLIVKNNDDNFYFIDDGANKDTYFYNLSGDVLTQKVDFTQTIWNGYSADYASDSTEPSGTIDLTTPVEDSTYEADSEFGIEGTYWNYGETSAPYDLLNLYIRDVDGNFVYGDEIFCIETDNVIEEKSFGFIPIPLVLLGNDYRIDVVLKNSTTGALSSDSDFANFNLTYTPPPSTNYSWGHKWTLQNTNALKDAMVYPQELYYKAGSDYVVSYLHEHTSFTPATISNYAVYNCVDKTCTTYNETYIADTDYYFDASEVANSGMLNIKIDPVVDTEWEYYKIEYIVDAQVVSQIRFFVHGDDVDGSDGSIELIAPPDWQNVCGNSFLVSDVCKLLIPSSVGLANISNDFSDFIDARFPIWAKLRDSFTDGFLKLLVSETTVPSISASSSYKGSSIQLWNMSILDNYMPTFRMYMTYVLWLAFFFFVIRRIMGLYSHDNEPNIIKL